MEEARKFLWAFKIGQAVPVGQKVPTRVPCPQYTVFLEFPILIPTAY
jgi:hypothetical protein